MTEFSNRCRLVLIASPAGEVPASASAITQAMKGGDVASVILAGFGAQEDKFRAWCEEVVPIVQNAGAAAVVVDDTQAAGRSKADGIHVMSDKKSLGEAVRKFQPKWIVGTEVLDSRHEALELGEERPDYLFIGKLDGDTHPAANPKALEMAEWWAAMIEIPCIVLSGYETASVIEAAATGAEFVAASASVFGEGRDPEQSVRTINALLDEHAPQLPEAENGH